MTQTDRENTEALAGADARESLVAVDRAVAEIRRGGFVVLIGAGNTAVVMQAAEATTPQSLDRLAELAGRYPNLVLTAHRAAALGLPAPKEGPVVLELGEGSAAQEIRDIADPAASVSFRLPPLHEDGSLSERDCFAAAAHLTKLARLLPAALVAVVPGTAAQAKDFAARHDLLLLASAEVAAYDLGAARSLRPVSQARVPLAGAEDARIIAYRPADGGIEHLAIIIGSPKSDGPVLTRLHSECFTGDLLGSLRCDCGDQLRGAIEEISKAGAGILIYLAQEGRGIGLVNKLRAYNLQDEGLDTLDANRQLGFDADERIYLPAAEILRDLGFHRVRLMTNNPEKVAALTRCGIEVTERVAHVFPSNVHNEAYLEAKRSKSGHLF
ncbi:MAG: GTP cyclohydrolase II [Alphaproteobacteria bacterium]|nr:GTP cyclohydrolase II [Alphaproteobacteria bacterium]